MSSGSHTVQAQGPPDQQTAAATIVLIDDQQLIRSAVRQVLVAAGMEVVGEAETARSGVQTVVHLRPDVALMDFALPGALGIETIEHISLLAPATRILVLTAVSLGWLHAVVLRIKAAERAERATEAEAEPVGAAS